MLCYMITVVSVRMTLDVGVYRSHSPVVVINTINTLGCSALHARTREAKRRRHLTRARGDPIVPITGEGGEGKLEPSRDWLTEKYSTLLVFTSVNHTSPSPTASLARIVPTRSPFLEISKSQKIRARLATSLLRLYLL